MHRRTALALAISGALVGSSALAAAGSLGAFDGLFSGDSSAVYAPPVPMAAGGPTTTSTSTTVAPPAGPIIVTLPRFVEVPTGAEQAAATPVSAPRAHPAPAPEPTAPAPAPAPAPVTSLPSTTPNTAEPAPAPTTTTTAPAGAEVPSDWPASQPVPPMPDGCVEPHLEDDGTWNCQH